MSKETKVVIPAQVKTTSKSMPYHFTSSSFDLAGVPVLRRLMDSRWPLFAARALTLAGFVFTILAGLWGTRVGSHNFAIIFVWIAWWTALKLVFIPLGGRAWCSICPLPMPGEWLQQGGLINKHSTRRGLGLNWPKKLRGRWLQTGFFVVIGLFSALTLTDPRVTGWVLLLLVLLATGMSLVFKHRSFCTYICPIGGFTGMYAKTSPIELRVKDARVCTEHNVKTCYNECPWGLYPLALKDSQACGLCMECLRVCPQDNIALKLRPFGTDLNRTKPSTNLDEVFLALVMLGSALTFAAVFSGPWEWLKNAAFSVGSLPWLGYAGSFLLLTLLVLPLLFTAAVALSLYVEKSKLSLRQAMNTAAQALLPLGLFTWIAFTVSFAIPKAGYVFTVISDPFGWGWNLFGTAQSSWILDAAQFSALIQVIILLVGLVWASRVAVNSAQQHTRNQTSSWAALPLVSFNAFITLCMLWLLVGL